MNTSTSQNIKKAIKYQTYWIKVIQAHSEPHHVWWCKPQNQPNLSSALLFIKFFSMRHIKPNIPQPNPPSSPCAVTKIILSDYMKNPLIIENRISLNLKKKAQTELEILSIFNLVFQDGCTAMGLKQSRQILSEEKKRQREKRWECIPVFLNNKGSLAPESSSDNSATLQ